MAPRKKFPKLNEIIDRINKHSSHRLACPRGRLLIKYLIASLFILGKVTPRRWSLPPFNPPRSFDKDERSQPLRRDYLETPLSPPPPLGRELRGQRSIRRTCMEVSLPSKLDGFTFMLNGSCLLTYSLFLFGVGRAAKTGRRPNNYERTGLLADPRPGSKFGEKLGGKGDFFTSEKSVARKKGWRWC